MSKTPIKLEVGDTFQTKSGVEIRAPLGFMVLKVKEEYDQASDAVKLAYRCEHISSGDEYTWTQDGVCTRYPTEGNNIAWDTVVRAKSPAEDDVIQTQDDDFLSWEAAV